MRMTASQRKQAQTEAYKAYAARFYARHAERDAVRQCWIESPERKAQGWKPYLMSIGRMDLYNAQCLSALYGGPIVARDQEYE